MTLPKCCITCAFCYKKLFKDSRYSLSNNFSTGVILIDDAKNALIGNWDFLDIEQHIYQKWVNEYKEKEKDYIEEQERKEEERKINHTCSPAYQIFREKLDSKEFSFVDDVDMPSQPFGPVNDVALCCYEKNIKDVKKHEIKDKLMLVNEFPCDFYFPIEERGEKDFEACRKQRDLNKQIARDKLQEKMIKTELENAEQMQGILNETKLVLKKTDEKIENIIGLVAKTNNITNEIANYTDRNEKSTKIQFKCTIVFSIIAIIISIVTLLFSYYSSKNQEELMNTFINKQDQVFE